MGNIQEIVPWLTGSSWFTFIDLASGFFYLSIVEMNRTKAFRDAFGQSWGYVGCGVGLQTLPPVVTIMVTDVLGDFKGNGA